MGNVSVLIDAEATVIITTGVAGTGAVGTPSTQSNNVFPILGERGTSELGTATVNAQATVSLTGVSATASVGTFNIWSLIDDSQNPNWTEIAA